MSADFGHYKNIGRMPSAAEQKASLAEIVAASRAKEAEREAEYQRVAKENHHAFMERFREGIKNDDGSPTKRRPTLSGEVSNGETLAAFFYQDLWVFPY